MNRVSNAYDSLLYIKRFLHSKQVAASKIKLVEMGAVECSEKIVDLWEKAGMPGGRFEIDVRFVPYGVDSGL